MACCGEVFSKSTVAHAKKWVTRVKPRPFQGQFVVHAGSSYDRPAVCTKLEISTFTHYEDMKDDENAEIVVIWGIRGHPRSSTT